jgi:uncharacterized SAM-binding protein YcdF (DUF218 family)
MDEMHLMDTAFFYFSKIIWSLVTPDALLSYLFCAGVLCLVLNKLKAAKILLVTTTVICLVIAVVPVGQLLIYPLENRFATNPELPAKVDGIILLGGTIQAQMSHAWSQSELTSSAEREIAFARIAREYPQAKLLMSGGNGNVLDQDYREADISRSLLAELGMDVSNIVFERDARNTFENAVNSKPLMQPKPGETWLLVTSAYHMPRSVGVFCKQGWPVMPWPVDHQTSVETLKRLGFSLMGNLYNLRVAIHEWGGLIVYYMTGKTTAVLPERC